MRDCLWLWPVYVPCALLRVGLLVGPVVAVLRLRLLPFCCFLRLLPFCCFLRFCCLLRCRRRRRLSLPPADPLPGQAPPQPTLLGRDACDVICQVPLHLLAEPQQHCVASLAVELQLMQLFLHQRRRPCVRGGWRRRVPCSWRRRLLWWQDHLRPLNAQLRSLQGGCEWHRPSLMRLFVLRLSTWTWLRNLLLRRSALLRHESRLLRLLPARPWAELLGALGVGGLHLLAALLRLLQVRPWAVLLGVLLFL